MNCLQDSNIDNAISVFRSERYVSGEWDGSVKSLTALDDRLGS